MDNDAPSLSSSTPIEASIHSYLGNDLQDVASPSEILEPESVLEIPLILLKGVVLMPMETLPLKLSLPEHIQLIKDIIRLHAPTPEGRRRRLPTHLGVLNTKRLSPIAVGRRSSNNSHEFFEICENVGTTIEILSTQEILRREGEREDEAAVLVVRTRGRHRFRLLPSASNSFITTRDGVLFACVKILADESLPSLASILPVPRFFKYEHSDRFQYTYWGRNRVMKLFEPQTLVKKAQSILRSMPAWEAVKKAAGIGEYSFDCCEDPVIFSYKLAANLPLDDETRQGLLTANVVYRLRLEIQLLKSSANRPLCCSRCRAPLASKQAVFIFPGSEGTTGAYANAAGFVHQTLTVTRLLDEEEEEEGKEAGSRGEYSRAAAAARAVGRRWIHVEEERVSEHSWFPNYAWSICYCKRCNALLGWLFTFCGGEGVDNHQGLDSFWGFRRAALTDGKPLNKDTGDMTDSSSNISESGEEEEEGEEAGLLLLGPDDSSSGSSMEEDSHEVYDEEEDG